MPEPTMSGALLFDLDRLNPRDDKDRQALARLCVWSNPTRYTYEFQQVEIPLNTAAPGDPPSVVPLCGARFSPQGTIQIFLAQLSYVDAALPASGVLPPPPRLDLQFRFGLGSNNIQFPDPVAVPAGSIPYFYPAVGSLNSKVVQVSGTAFTQFEIWGCASADVPNARAANIVRAVFAMVSLPDPGCCTLTVDPTPFGAPPGP